MDSDEEKCEEHKLQECNKLDAKALADEQHLLLHHANHGFSSNLNIDGPNMTSSMPSSSVARPAALPNVDSFTEQAQLVLNKSRTPMQFLTEQKLSHSRWPLPPRRELRLRRLAARPQAKRLQRLCLRLPRTPLRMISKQLEAQANEQFAKMPSCINCVYASRISYFVQCAHFSRP